MSAASDRSPGTAVRDPFALELIKNALATLADEMALTISRTARSFVVKEALDFSTALFLADGELIAQGTCLPPRRARVPEAVRPLWGGVPRPLRRSPRLHGTLHPGGDREAAGRAMALCRSHRQRRYRSRTHPLRRDDNDRGRRHDHRLHGN